MLCIAVGIRDPAMTAIVNRTEQTTITKITSCSTTDAGLTENPNNNDKAMKTPDENCSKTIAIELE